MEAAATDAAAGEVHSVAEGRAWAADSEAALGAEVAAQA